MKPEELAQFEGPDDGSVADDEIFWRRIYPGWIVRDDGVDGSRLTSEVYEDTRTPAPSPCSLIRSTESTVEQVQKHQSYAVGAVRAGLLRAHGFKLIRHDDPDEPGHFYMVGKNDRSKPCKLNRLKLAGETEHVAGPQWGPGHVP